MDAPQARERRAATLTLLMLAAMLALSLAGCGSSSARGEPEDGPSRASVDDGNPKMGTQKEVAATHPDLLAAAEEANAAARDVKDGTERLVKNEQARAARAEDDLDQVEDIGREHIESARVVSETWSAEDDPLCTEPPGWPPPGVPYNLLPPYEPPFDLRTDIDSKARGVNGQDVSDARDAVGRLSGEVKEHPSDPLADESRYTIDLVEEDITLAEKEMARGEEMEQSVRDRQQEIEELYARWDAEYERLFDDIAC